MSTPEPKGAEATRALPQNDFLESLAIQLMEIAADLAEEESGALPPQAKDVDRSRS